MKVELTYDEHFNLLADKIELWCRNGIQKEREFQRGLNRQCNYEHWEKIADNIYCEVYRAI